jgi:O-antigen ligase/Flp pilus assembly protein TadD
MSKNNEKTLRQPLKNYDLFSTWCDRIIFWLLLATVFIVPVFFNIYSFDQFEMPKIMVLRVLVCAMLAIWAVKTFENGRFEYTATPLDFALLGWVILNIVTTFTGFAPQLSLRGEYENFSGSIANITYVVLYYIVVNFIKTKKQITAAALSLMVSGFLITIYATAQFFGHDFIKWNAGSMIQGRYFATLGNPNFLGALLIMIIPFNISYLIGTIKTKRFALSAVLIAMLALLIISLIGTQSRGPFAGFIFSMIFYALYLFYGWRKRTLAKTENSGKNIWHLFLDSVKANKKIAIVAVVFITAAGIFLATLGRISVYRLWDSAVHPAKSFSTSRLHIWIPAIKIIEANPVFGTGVDTFKTVFPQYEGTNFAKIDGANVSSRTAHNELLNIGATMGLVSLGIYLLLIWSFTKVWLRSRTLVRDEPMELLSLSMFAAFLAYFIQNLFSFGVAAINTALYVIMAMQVSMYLELTGRSKRKSITLYNHAKQGAAAFKTVFQFLSIALFALLAVKSYTVFDADLHYNRGKIFAMYKDNYNYQLAVNLAQQKDTPENVRADFISSIQTAQSSSQESNAIKQKELSRNAVISYQKALDAYAVYEHQLAVKEAPGEVKYHVYLGLAYEKAAEVLTQTGDTAGSNALLHKAVVSYEKGVQLNPGNSYYWGNLGRVYYLLAHSEDIKYVDKSIGYYQTAINKAPVTGLFYSNLIDVLLSMGQMENAQPLMDKLESLDAKLCAGSYFTAGNVFYGKKILDKAETAYRKSIELDPDLSQAYFNLGVVCYAKNDRNCVKYCMETFISKSPDSNMAPQAKTFLKRSGF